LSIYGRYVPGSDGWDDGYEAMRDSGEGSSEYHIYYAEWDPDVHGWFKNNLDDYDFDVDNECDVVGDDDIDEDAETVDSGASAPVSAEPRRRTLSVPEPDTYLRTLIDTWQDRWGDLTELQRRRFFRHRATWELTNYPETIVLRAIRSVRKLDDALTLVQNWADGDTWLDIDDEEPIEPAEDDEEELVGSDDDDVESEDEDDESEDFVTHELDVPYEAAWDALEGISPDLIEAEGAAEALLRGVIEDQSVDDVCRELDDLIARNSYYNHRPVDRERVRQALKYIRGFVEPGFDPSMDEYSDEW